MSGLRAAGGPVIPNFGQGTACLRHNHWFCPSWVRAALGRHPPAGARPAHRADADRRRDRLRDRLPARARRLPLAGLRGAARGGRRLSLHDARASRSSRFSCRSPGSTVTTIEIPLVAYTLFVLYRNIMAGLRGVPPEVLESARGMGLTRRQTFLRVELPLAVPAIMAGLRVATVATISIATIAAFLIHYGLGSADLRRARPAGHLPDGARRRRRPRDPARAGRRPGCSHSCSVPSRPGAGSDDVVASLFVDALRFIPDNAPLLLDKAVETAELAFTALGIALVARLPLGLWLGHRHRGLRFALGVVVGRAARCRASCSSASSSPGSASASGTSPWRSSCSGSRRSSRTPTSPWTASTETSSRRRGGWGSTERQILTRVELPLGLPLLLAGFRIAAVFVIATATIAGIAGRGRRPRRDHRQPRVVRRLGRAGGGVLRRRDRAPDGVRARPRPARGLAQDGSEGVGSRGRKAPRGQIPRGGHCMFRKHTRRAAKAAFAISFGVALLIGLAACGGGGGSGSTARRRAPGRGRSRRSRSARRTSARSTSSASSTARRSRRRASTSSTRGASDPRSSPTRRSRAGR